MSYTDKTMKCAECSADFTFLATEQEFFASRGYKNEPKRCPSCRESRRRTLQGSSGFANRGPNRPMYSAVCAQCGTQTQIPFEPRQGRPVYCNTCYAQVRDNPKPNNT